MPSLRYPMAALRRQHEGEVILRVRVTGGGEVVDVGVSQSSGDADLDRAAEEGIRQWRFARPSDPAGLTADFPVRFQLAATL
jgi:protein TonB